MFGRRPGIDWIALREGFWFVPTLMAAIAAGASFGTVALDHALGESTIGRSSWGYSGGPDGARLLLSTIAGSMITVAGVSFSITIAALALASSQFGPRLLRNFVRDIGNQIVLGTFIATFLYCLLVLRTVRGPGDNNFVPYISVTVGLLLSTASLGVLIYFVHHVSSSIQATTIIAGVGDDLDEAISRLFPTGAGHGEPMPTVLPDLPDDAIIVLAGRSGYIQSVDLASLMHVATRHDLLVRIERHPGGFVARGGRLASVASSPPINDDAANEIANSFTIGNRRTPLQDVEYSVDQLVEVAVRALSPGINDPFTAMACVDRLGAALVRLVAADFPSPYRFDRHGRLRIIAQPITFGSVLDAAFNQIRQYGRSSAAVTMRLMESIAVIAEHTTDEERLNALRRQAMMIERGSREGMGEAQDWQDIDKRYRSVIEALKANEDQAPARE